MRARRILLTLAAVLLLATPAAAQWRGGRGGGYGRGWAAPESGGRGGGFRQGPRGGFGGYAPAPPPAGYGGYGPRGEYGSRGGYRPRAGGFAGRPGGYGPPAFDGYGGAPQRPAQALRRGQVVPQGYAGARVADPGRYHLRDAPNGFDWLGDGRDAYLVQRSTGMVLDSVPGAYQPPRGGGRGGRGRRGDGY